MILCRKIYSIAAMLLLPLLVAPAAAQPDTLSHGGLTRDYLVHTPVGYDGSQPTALVLAFHGGFGSSENIERQSGLSTVSDEEGFIVVYPNGTGGIPTWNGGECCGFAARENTDDVGFVNALLDTLELDFNVDSQRIYATGISNGAAMSYRLACELSERIVAIAPVAATYRNESCNPTFPIPIVHFHSEVDTNVPIEGGVGTGPTILDWLPLDSTLANFAELNGCQSQSTEQVSNSLNVTTWNDCFSPNALQLYLVADGGHSWPGGTKTLIGDTVSTAVDASRAMWGFFEQFAGHVTIKTVEENRENSALDLNVFPNPSSDAAKATITLERPSFVQVQIFDAIGRVVSSPSARFAQTGRVTFDLPVDELANGVYFVIVRADGQKASAVFSTF